MCGKDKMAMHLGASPLSGEQSRLRLQRTRKDWDEVTDPINHGAIRAGVMPEQYAGLSRDAIRAFLVSDDDVAVVPHATPSMLDATIHTLGLQDEIYAEQRSDQTVLRRIARQTKTAAKR